MAAAEQLEVHEQNRISRQRMGQGMGQEEATAAAAESRQRVGRWGEELAYHMLLSAASDGRLDQILPGVTSMGAVAGPPGSPLHPQVTERGSGTTVKGNWEGQLQKERGGGGEEGRGNLEQPGEAISIDSFTPRITNVVAVILYAQTPTLSHPLRLCG
jgi:hypothetical protein